MTRPLRLAILAVLQMLRFSSIRLGFEFLPESRKALVKRGVQVLLCEITVGDLLVLVSILFDMGNYARLHSGVVHRLFRRLVPNETYWIRLMPLLVLREAVR